MSNRGLYFLCAGMLFLSICASIFVGISLCLNGAEKTNGPEYVVMAESPLSEKTIVGNDAYTKYWSNPDIKVRQKTKDEILKCPDGFTSHGILGESQNFDVYLPCWKIYVGNEVLKSNDEKMPNISVSAGIPYFPKNCTVESLREHKKLIDSSATGQIISHDPSCVFLSKQHEIDLYAQLAVEDAKNRNVVLSDGHNAVITTNGALDPIPQWKLPTPAIPGQLWRITTEGNWEAVDSKEGYFKCGPLKDKEGPVK